MGFTKLLPTEQPLREGARQRRRIDPRGGLKTNVKLSIPHACHFERSRENFVIRGQGLTLFPTCAARLAAFLICLSYRLCPIRPFGAPSPRGEGCDTRIASSKVAAKPPPQPRTPNLKSRDGVTELLPTEQPLREGARQRRRMDPRGGLKTNVKLSISHTCHSERGEKTFPAEPSEPVEPAPPLSQTIKGQHPPNLEGRDVVYGTPPR